MENHDKPSPTVAENLELPFSFLLPDKIYEPI